MRTFVLGAGASKTAGYPLANELWTRITQWVPHENPPNPHFSDAVNLLNERFDAPRSFEKALTRLDDEVAPISDPRRLIRKRTDREIRLIYGRNAIARMIREYFNTCRHKPARIYDDFVRDVLSIGDTLITFNYDLALDLALRESGKWSIRNGYGFEIDCDAPGPSSCKLLKLHGSTNWHGELFGGILGASQVDPHGPLGWRPVIAATEFDYLGYSGLVDRLCHTTGSDVVAMILPTHKKRFHERLSSGKAWEKFWDALWGQAEWALGHSKEIYLIGYSVNRFDQRARKLLSDNFLDGASVKVCCGTDTRRVTNSLKRLTGRRPDIRAAVGTTFETLIERFGDTKKATMSA